MRVVTIGLLCCIFTSCGVGIEEPTPLAKAIGDQDLAKVERLLDQGADPNKRSLLFPLESAAAHENVEILKLLLARGAILQRAVDQRSGWSPLFAAAQDGPPEAVQVLLDSGADPCLRTSASWVKGMRPSEVARHRDNVPVAPMLESAERAACPPGT